LDALLEAPPPNKRLKLTGHRTLKNSVLPFGHETKRFQLPGHLGRQLSREPLGGDREANPMKHEASRTAEAVAFARALETAGGEQLRLFADPFAEHFLPRSMRMPIRLTRVPLLGNGILALGDLLLPGGWGNVVGRTCFIDSALCCALRDGVDQVVILGAGYDCRAYRLPELGGARVFEVDHPKTQSRKHRILNRLLSSVPANVTFVPIDFDRQSLATAMANKGLVPGRRSFFIWEGVIQYLNPESVDATLRYVAEASCSDSYLAFTYVDLGLVRGTKSFRGAKRLTRLVRLFGEPFTFGIDPSDLRSFLQARGLELVEDVGGSVYVERYFAPRGRRLSVNDYERAVLARVAEKIAA
jgi:methyltransferase (TIGR00027 family)